MNSSLHPVPWGWGCGGRGCDTYAATNTDQKGSPVTKMSCIQFWSIDSLIVVRTIFSAWNMTNGGSVIGMQKLVREI